MEANLLLVRDPEQPDPKKRTFGKLFLTPCVSGKPFCFTLEDPVRLCGTKVHGDTAIPAGTYEVILNVSNRFKRLMPLLLNVPNYQGVRLHGGNTEKNTLGCPLVAYKKGLDRIWQSAEADLTRHLLQFDKITLEIR